MKSINLYLGSKPLPRVLVSNEEEDNSHVFVSGLNFSQSEPGQQVFGRCQLREKYNFWQDQAD